MKTTADKQLIIKLIRDSLISIKLISGLNSLGLNADDYAQFLGDTIFELMGFENSEQSDLIFENVYLGNAEKVRSIDFSQSTEDLDKLSEEIYKELLFAKEVCDKK
jgi:hypothetical protein